MNSEIEKGEKTHQILRRENNRNRKKITYETKPNNDPVNVV